MKVGPYEVVSELGRGAMGVVYRARDPQAGREVALELCAGVVDATRLQRFRREGQVASALRHPGIVQVHAMGEAGGRPWIAYERVEGRALGWDLTGDAPVALDAFTRPSGGALLDRDARARAGLLLPGACSLDVSPDGPALVVGTMAGAAHVWPVPR